MAFIKPMKKSNVGHSSDGRRCSAGRDICDGNGSATAPFWPAWHVPLARLPQVTIISVAHRAELETFHSRKIKLEHRKGGAY